MAIDLGQHIISLNVEASRAAHSLSFAFSAYACRRDFLTPMITIEYAHEVISVQKGL